MLFISAILSQGGDEKRLTNLLRGKKTMKSIAKFLGAILSVTLVLTGCAPSISPDTYASSSAGEVNKVIAGVVVSARPVTVSGDTFTPGGGMIGTLAGGAAGAIAGSQIGHNSGSALAAIGGAVAGGMLGNYAEKKITQQTGMEYIVRTKDGSMLSVVQGLQPNFQRGQHVLVEYGDRARVISDPGYNN